MRPTDQPDLPPDASIAALVRHALAGSVTRLLHHDPGARRGDTDDIHDMRVATRRLRSHLRTFGPLLDDGWSQSLAGELGWLADAIGHVRDADVVLEWLGTADTAAADPAIAGHVQGERAVALTTLTHELQGERYTRLLESLVVAVEAPGFADEKAIDVEQPAAEVAPRLARRSWRRLRRAVEELPDDPSDRQLHRVRIRAKRCRYAAEAVAAVVGPDATRFAKAVSELQTVLGEHQDTVLAEATLRRSAEHEPDLAPAVTQLIAALHEERRRLRCHWPEVWEATSAKRLRRWF